MSEDRDLVVEVAALKVVSEYTAQRYEARRADLVEEMTRGDRLTGVDPADPDAKIVSITRTDPKPVVSVNVPELTPWMAEHYPDLTETETEIIASQKQLEALLFEHAPHLLRRRTRIKPDALIELRATCVALGCAMGPGGEADVPGVRVDRPKSTLSVRLADGAIGRVLSLIRTGRLQFDGAARPLLEESRDDSA